MYLLASVGAFAPVDQHYPLQARQMQALSVAVHIPLVAFGISLTAMVLFAEWFGHKTGDPLYLTLARRLSGGDVGPLTGAAVACLIAGFGLLNLADASWAHGVGIICLLGFVLLGFRAITFTAVHQNLADPGTLAGSPLHAEPGVDRDG